LRAGDRFVIRSSAPLNTIAGGVIVDPYAPKRARPWPVGLNPAERLARLVDEAGGQGVPMASLAVRAGVPPDGVRALAHDPVVNAELVAGKLLVSRDFLQSMHASLHLAVDEYHRAHSLEPGAPAQSLRSQLNASDEVAEWVLAQALGNGELKSTAGLIHKPDWSPSLSGGDEQLAGEVLRHLDSASSEPPSIDELATKLGKDPTPVLRYLERRGDVVQVERDRYYAADHLRSLISKLRTAMAGGVEASPSEIRDALGVSRKYLVPLLEYCDRVGYTNRHANGRVWVGT